MKIQIIELFNNSAYALLKRKGVGHKAISEGFETLRKALNSEKKIVGNELFTISRWQECPLKRAASCIPQQEVEGRFFCVNPEGNCEDSCEKEAFNNDNA